MAGGDDHADDPRHQAQRGHPGADQRAVSEIPDQWAAAVRRLRALAPLGDGPLELLVWQAIVGAWPASRERLHAYVEKAAREAGTSTAWTDGDPVFEARLRRRRRCGVRRRRGARRASRSSWRRRAAAGWRNGLGLKLVQLTSPGVPDVYQGSELWETSLVDPDNRRPVDFAERRALLARSTMAGCRRSTTSGAAKLLVTSRALRLRRDRPELFATYRPLEVVGDAAAHVVAFDRGGAVTVATRLLGRTRAHAVVGATPPSSWPTGTWRDVLTGTIHDGGTMLLADLLATYPVAAAAAPA